MPAMDAEAITRILGDILGADSFDADTLSYMASIVEDEPTASADQLWEMLGRASLKLVRWISRKAREELEGGPGGPGGGKRGRRHPLSVPWSSWLSFSRLPGLPGSSNWRLGQIPDRWGGSVGGSRAPPQWLLQFFSGP